MSKEFIQVYTGLHSIDTEMEPQNINYMSQTYSHSTETLDWFITLSVV